ncbi:unnamed protein product [Medioppia subpectinata]|uniref:C2H2-type domain-containing protein n=1 Tax=Medioppia subpectinata TaxID=1979941 RepID=A0A7R9Q7H7_9ACAR|nr:unnamed protein product [Medioppia subpectinata]CAG2114823.1 unnamed protein product [Medioppia subpectinata]
MGRNKRTIRRTNKQLLVEQPLKRALSQTGLKGNASTGFGSKSFKPVTNTALSTDCLELQTNVGSAQDNVTNDERLDSDCIDHSLTREPINLGVKNVQQILNCIKDSSLEVKDLILNECNIIYDSTENINPNNKSNKESIVSQKLQFIDKCVEKVDEEKQRQEECKQLDLQLTTIKTNPNAMFQKIQSNELNGDCNQTIIDKKKILCDLLKEAKNSRQLESSVSQTIKRQRIDEILPLNDDMSDENRNKSPTNETLMCDICDSTFTSTKTLRVHMKTIHSSNRLVYPCPLCSLAFKQLSNATRHLIQIHKRTKTQANSLKEVMKVRAYSTNSSENSSEVEDMSDEEMEEEVAVNSSNNVSDKCNTRSVGNENSKPSAPRVSTACQYKCGNVFDWAPAKTSHEKSCRKRLQIQNLTNGVSKAHKISSQTQSECDSSQELSIVPNISNHTSNASSNVSMNSYTNLILPNSIEEQIKEFTDLKSLQCTHCPTQDFMNLNQLLQHAVTHIGFSIYKCHGCAYLSIYENDMKYHLMNNHNIKEQMIGKHYQTLPDFKQQRLVIHPIKSTNSDDILHPDTSDSPERPERNTKLKIHLRPSASKLGHTSKKCYEIVDK